MGRRTLLLVGAPVELMGVEVELEEHVHLKAGGVEVLQEFVLLVDWLLTSGDLWTALRALFYERKQDHWPSAGNVQVSG